MPVMAARTRRDPGAISSTLRTFWHEAEVRAAAAVLSGATGVSGATDEELAALGEMTSGSAIHAVGDLLGHPLEAAAPVAAALAAALVASGQASEAVATCVGHRRGEGLVRLAAAQ
jgi:3-oxoacyl-[acyl-carrier-protein] synthase II